LAFVQLDEGENLESALRRFKRKVQQEAIIKEMKKRMKQAQARKRMRRRIKRERDVEY
jgi:small subunit ribosomal protein S21